MHFITVTDKIKNSSHFTKIFCKYKNILNCVPPVGRTVAVTNLWCRDKNQSCITRHPPSAGDDSRQGQWPKKSETELCSIIHRYSKMTFELFILLHFLVSTFPCLFVYKLCEQLCFTGDCYMSRSHYTLHLLFVSFFTTIFWALLQGCRGKKDLCVELLDSSEPHSECLVSLSWMLKLTNTLGCCLHFFLTHWILLELTTLCPSGISRNFIIQQFSNITWAIKDEWST